MESQVTFDDTGITLEVGSHKSPCTWKDISRIFVYKVDLFAVDLICMTIEAANYRLNFDEDAGGWLELVQVLPKYLRGCVPFAEWFLAVAFPAFETNPIVIYERGET